MLDAETIASRLFAALERGDTAAVAQLYAPDIEVWHNSDRAIQGREENLRTLTWMTASFPDLHYTDVRRQVTPNGFVQQHILVATNRAGDEVSTPACLVVGVRDGLITRLDEYLDSAHVAALMARPSEPDRA